MAVFGRPAIAGAFFILACIPAGAADNSEMTGVVHRFFTLVYRQCYNEAYKYFSASVRRDLSLAQFKEGAKDVRYLKIQKIEILDRENNLVKMKIRAIVHLIYRGNLHEAVYEGKISLYREKNLWKVLTVDLQAISQKILGKWSKPDKLQKLEF